eukprot:3896299-Heterocapsa_arctica.AAC.1
MHATTHTLIIFACLLRLIVPHRSPARGVIYSSSNAPAVARVTPMPAVFLLALQRHTHEVRRDL